MQRSPFRSDDQRLRASLSTSKLSPRSRENMDDSNLGHGMRDILLVKCKQAIEELHVELEDEKKVRTQTEEALAKIERETLDKESEVRELSHYNEKLAEENSQLRGKISTILDQMEQAEQQLGHSVTQERAFRELQENFQEVCQANNEMKLKNEKLTADIKKRDQVVKDWNDTLGSIDAKIAGLEDEKAELQKEKTDLLVELNNARNLYKESENLNQLLQGKCEYSERLSQQLERENRIMEELRDENRELQLTIERLREKAERLTQEVTATIDQQERDFLNEREQLAKDLEKKHEERILNYKVEHQREIERLQQTVDGLRVETQKLVAERDHVKQDFKSLNDKLHSKDRELKDVSESFTSKWEHVQKDKMGEIKKLKGIIEEQSELINSYERMIDKEKRENEDEKDRLQSQNRRLKDEVQELDTKNIYLNSKLQECQDELLKIQSEIKSTFSYEEEKNAKMYERANQLERQLFEKDTQIESSKEEIRTLKDNLKSKNRELDSVHNKKRDFNDELLNIRTLLNQATSENEELKDRQKDFDVILHRRIEEITGELRRERERRMEAEHLNTGLQEQVRTLESSLKKTTNIHLNELSRREEEIDQLRYQQRMEATKDTVVGTKEALLKRIDNIDRLSRSPYRENSPPNYSFSGVRSGLGSAERDYPQANTKRRDVEDSRRKERSITRFEDNPPSHRTAAADRGRPQHTEFLNKFKDVISKLENRLEKISHDMN